MSDHSDGSGILERLRARRSAGGERPPAPARRHRGDFRFNTLSVIVLVVGLGLGLGLQVSIGTLPADEELALVAAGTIAAAGILFLLPYWATVVIAVAAAWGTLPVVLSADLSLAAAGISLGLLVAPGVEIVKQWDKIVVLRLGRFHRVRGPGPLLLVPLLDSIAGYVDTRIRVTDFSAEKSLTRDTVPVHVDALAFWMIWDPQRAILEVQEFDQAVILSAQTALRASIGANDLSTLLSERERLGTEIQQIVDQKTNPWGITILSVEFKEILIPHELEEVLSRQAQASRERQARIILSRTEAEIAESFAHAAERYKDDPGALRLRAMSMVYEAMRTKGGLVLVPSDAVSSLNLGATLGVKAYADAMGAGEVGGAGDAGADAETAPVPGAYTGEAETGSGRGARAGEAESEPAPSAPAEPEAGGAGPDAG